MNEKEFPSAQVSYDTITPINQATGYGPAPGQRVVPEAPTSYGILGKIANWFTGWYDKAYNEYERELIEYDNWLSEKRYRQELADNWAMVYHTENYNSPENQKRLIEQAGLSKYLMYNSNPFVSSSGMNPPSHQQSQSGKSDKLDMSIDELLAFASFGVGLESTMLQNDLLASEIEGRTIDNGIKSIQAELLGHELKDAPDKYAFSREERVFRRNMFEREVAKIDLEISSLRNDKEYQEFLRARGLNSNDPSWMRMLAVASDPKRGATLRRFMSAMFAALAGNPVYDEIPKTTHKSKKLDMDSVNLEGLSLPTDPDWWRGADPERY